MKIMDAKNLQRLINSHNIAKINEQQAYYMGRNPALLAPAPKSHPDYRVPVPLSRVSVDSMAGYLVSPGSVKYTGDFYESTLKDIFDNNEEPIITLNVFKAACKHGMGFELHWMEDGSDQFVIVPNAQAIPVWSNDIRPKLSAFIWHRNTQDEDGNDVAIADVYYPDIIEHWVKAKNGWILSEVEQHGYGKVPVVVFTIDFDRANLYDHVREIMDLIDRLLSKDIADEAERFANMILALADNISEEDKPRLKELAVLTGMGGSDGDVRKGIAFIPKDIPTDFIKLALDTALDLFYESMMMPNPRKEDGSGPESGYARALKNQTFEFRCSSIEGNFLRGLQDRVRLIAENKVINYDGTDVAISLTRNLPYDVTTNAEIAAKLVGIWDTEAILDLFPAKVLSDEAKDRILKAKEAERENAFDVGMDEEDPVGHTDDRI